jgi:hypothetical protein
MSLDEGRADRDLRTPISKRFVTPSRLGDVLQETRSVRARRPDGPLLVTLPIAFFAGLSPARSCAAWEMREGGVLRAKKRDAASRKRKVHGEASALALGLMANTRRRSHDGRCPRGRVARNRSPGRRKSRAGARAVMAWRRQMERAESAHQCRL